MRMISPSSFFTIPGGVSFGANSAPSALHDVGAGLFRGHCLQFHPFGRRPGARAWPPTHLAQRRTGIGDGRGDLTGITAITDHWRPLQGMTRIDAPVFFEQLSEELERADELE
jgi:hypothetical protein